MIQTMRIAAVCALTSIAPACGSGGDQGKTNVGGSVQDQAFIGKVADFDMLGDGTLLVAIADAGGICKLAEATDGGPPSFDLQWLSLIVCAGTTGFTGDYPITPDFRETSCSGKIAYAEIRRFIGGVASQVPADGGMLSVVAYSDQSLNGRLTLDFGGQAVAGEFTAGYCAALNH